MTKFLEEFSSNINFKDFDTLKSIYDYKSKELASMHKMRIYLFTELMKELIETKTITKFDSAIDIGCNRGFYSKLISELGFKKVIGIDIDEPLLKLAKEKFELQR